jgi:hypothetical protein
LDFLKDMLAEIVGGLLICITLAAVVAYLKPTTSVVTAIATPIVGLGAYGAFDIIRRKRGGDESVSAG